MENTERHRKGKEKMSYRESVKTKGEKYVEVEMENRQKRRNMVNDIEDVEGRGKGEDEENRLKKTK